MQDFLVDINKAQEIGLLFRKSREMMNLTISSVSKKVKINIADLSRLETGLKLRINPFHVVKLCELYRLSLLDINLGYLDEKNLLDYYSNFSLKTQETNDIKNKIPIFNLSSFENDYYSSDIFEEYIFIPSDENVDLKAIRIDNDLMFPFFKKNSLVLFNFDDTRISDGCIGLFKIKDRYSIGRYYLDRNFIVVSYENKNYSPVVIEKKLDFLTIGKYIGHISIWYNYNYCSLL